ncbi:MAG: 50S ribosomal protein L11 methyltransferase [Bacteroidota bacterium]
MIYIEIEFKLAPFNPWNEVLVAYLADLEFESFQEDNPILRAYISEDSFNNLKFEKLIAELKAINELEFSYDLNKIPQQNWNAVWESQFEPVFIENKLRIIAPFHERSDFNGQTIIIEPKMSFGTGHHQTTYLMCKRMFDLALKNKHVLDMGSGTGVLAILAEKLGAKNVEAFDIEPWSVENCDENALKNECSKITSLLGDIELVQGKYDVILANINKNVLKRQIPYYSKLINSKGHLLLSGFFFSDVDEINDYAIENGFEIVNSDNRESWSMLHFTKI